jgi:acetylglutamate kinase
MDKLVDKAKVLIEALPYMQRFVGKIVVIKYGGNAMTNESLRRSFAVDVVLLKHIGVLPVIVHGGGPQIKHTLGRLGLESRFVGGLRVTDDETMEVVEMVLGGTVNREIVELIQLAGASAVGLTGSDGALLRVRQKSAELGRVGDVSSVDPRVLTAMAEADFVPVVAPLGADDKGLTYNINADEAAGAIAGALGAEKLILLTDVDGVMDRQGNRFSQLTIEETRKHIEEGTIKGGMIPKVHCCMDALSQGVARTHIVDGRVLHAVLLEIFTDDAGVGTLLVP